MNVVSILIQMGCRVAYGHEAGLGAIWFGSLDTSCQAEIADLEVAVRVEKEVRRFEVAVDDIRAMQCLESAEGLVHKVLTAVTVS